MHGLLRLRAIYSRARPTRNLRCADCGHWKASAADQPESISTSI